jgi:hypothetical protein
LLVAMLPTESTAQHMPAAHARATVYERSCLAAAFALTLAWFFIYNHFMPAQLVDEPGHLGNIWHFLEGKPGWPGQMTMLPGYHYLVVSLWQLHPPVGIVTFARLVVTLCSFLGLIAFAAGWRTLHRPAAPLATAGPATLLFALLPILQPFTGLAYTDAPALAFALFAVAVHLAGHYGLAALAFIPALLTRQTNILWPAFLLVYEILAPVAFLRRPENVSGLKSAHPAAIYFTAFFRRTRWLLLLLAACAAAIGLALTKAGRLTPGTETGNDLGFNPAGPHIAALLVLLLGLPVWLAHLPAFFRSLRLWPTLLLLCFAVFFALTFKNPHPWNRDLFWDGCSFTLLRNWPLVWLDTHPWLRALSAVNIVLMILAVQKTIARQRPTLQLPLSLIVLFGLVQPFTNTLIEPRYHIPLVAFFLLYLDLTPSTTRRLTLWWLFLCVLHAPFIAKALSLW